MKETKTTTNIYCDDCGKLIPKMINRQGNTWEPEKAYSIYISYFNKSLDLCSSCLDNRLSHSFSICKNRICPECGGKGYIKEGYYHNEYNKVKCSKCNSKGVLSLGEN